MAEDHRGSIEEYRALRGEICDTSRVVSNVCLAGISATALLLGYGLSMKSGVLFLLPFVVLIPMLCFLTSQLENIVTIATYILFFLESIGPGCYGKHGGSKSAKLGHFLTLSDVRSLYHIFMGSWMLRASAWHGGTEIVRPANCGR